MGHSIVLTYKKIILLLMVIFMLAGCASQQHNPKPPKKKRCNCPRFSQELFIDTYDNYTIERDTDQTNG
jgi:uncharacterized lipoprotein YajG